MKRLKKSHFALIVLSLLILSGCVGMTAYLLFSNYRNVRLFKQAQSNFLLGDDESLTLAEAQLQQLICNDGDNEAAYIMLGDIAGRRKIYPEQLYYCYMAQRLNPLSAENRANYIRSLGFARYFDRLENFLAQSPELTDEQRSMLYYAAGRNGNIFKYRKEQFPDSVLVKLADLLYGQNDLSASAKLAVLSGLPDGDDFIKQEMFAAKAELLIVKRDLDNAENVLKQAYELNPFAFAPALGRFYANCRSFGRALPVFEKYLADYHDPEVAMRTAEIYCLLNEPDKINRLRSRFQSDDGNIGMLCCYYFDALAALAQKNMSALKELTVPLRNSIKSPLAAFMFLCADLEGGDPAVIRQSYTSLLTFRDEMELQAQADTMISVYLKRAFAAPEANVEPLLALAAQLYERKPEPFTAKIILLSRKKRNTLNQALINDARRRFGNDPGIIKIAIEYYLEHELAESERLIALYKSKFPARQREMLRYEIVLAMKKNDLNRVSKLFKDNFSPDIAAAYWNFAATAMREDDLRFLSRDTRYEPFCRALLLLKKGERNAACDLLEKADAGTNQELLFFAARTLAENGRNQAALNKYALFPEKSSYRLTILLNTAELYAENGSEIRALSLARQAWEAAPELPETQLCYADKLSRCRKLSVIPDVVKLSNSAYRRELEKLYISGMEARIKAADCRKAPETFRNLCETLLQLDKRNEIAIAGLLKFREEISRRQAPELQKQNRRE